jgi:hypothetical protein
MNRRRAMETLRGLDPVGDADTGSAGAPEARRLLASIVASEPGARRRAGERRRLAAVLAVAAVLVVPAGFGLWRAFQPLLGGGPGPGPGRSHSVASGPTRGSGPTSISPRPPASQRYEATGMVVQVGDRPAELCLGGMTLEFPPHCGTMPITNWSWDRVEGETSAAGRTWGQYHLVGTSDGTTFTVSEAGPPRPEPSDPMDAIVIPCAEPSGGWIAPDPSRTTRADLEAAIAAAEAQPDSAGAWMKYLVQPATDGSFGPNDVVLNAAFTGNLDAHRHELARLWGGPTCVVRFDRTETELRGIQDELTRRGPDEFGYRLLFAATDIVRNRVEIGVVVADERLRAALDERFGPGVVVVVPALRPVA